MADEQRDPVDQQLRDLLTAIFKYERWVREEGFKAGWAAAVRKLEKERAVLPESQAPHPQGLVAQFAQFMENNPPKVVLTRPPSASELVLRAITEKPGLKGVNLLAYARTIEPQMHERTFRTALHRLRHQHKKIENVDGRWYLAGEAPADPQADLMESDMPPPDR